MDTAASLRYNLVMLRMLHMQDLYFLLPEDFEGGLAEALRVMADYHEAVVDTPKQKVRAVTKEENELTLAESREKTFHDFWDMIHDASGKRLCGHVSLSEFDPEANEMAHLDLNDGKPDP